MAKGKRRFGPRIAGTAARSGTSDTVAAEAYKKKPNDIVFEEEATMEQYSFTDNAVCLYGPVKIGKSTLAHLIPDVYFLPTEIGFRWVKTRKTLIPDWATFKKFVKLMEDKPKLVETVSMWCIDTISNLSVFCSQFVCGREKISHPSDQEWGKGWDAIRDEFVYWLMRLGILGPGILFIAHEKEREIVSHSMTITKRGPDLVKTHYNPINEMCDLILRMDFSPRVKKQKIQHGRRKGIDILSVERCIFTKPTETMEAGDRTGKLPEKIYFKTEKEAIKQILDVFD